MTIEEKLAMLEEIMDLDEGTLSVEDALNEYMVINLILCRG